MLFIKSFRTLLTGSLLVGLTVPTVFGASPAPSKAVKAKIKSVSAQTKAVSLENKKLLVYYFHGSARCMTCRNFESFTDEVLNTAFADEIKNSRVEFRVVNVDESANEHFIKDYGLYTKSVVLSETKENMQVRWKNLDKIWDLARDETAFKQYIRDEVASYLKEG